MSSIRRYVPSRALLRALAWAPSAHRGAVRRAHTSAQQSALPTRKTRSRTGSAKDPSHFKAQMARLQQATDDEVEQMAKPMSQDAVDNPNSPTVEWYERELNGQGPDTLVKRMATLEDRRKYNELAKMLDEYEANPDRDNTLLDRRLLDELATDSSFSDLADELRAMQEDVMTENEVQETDEETSEEQEDEVKALQSSLQMFQHDVLQELIDDPELASAREGLESLQSLMSSPQDLEKPEIRQLFLKVQQQLVDCPAFERRLASLQGDDEDPSTELREFAQDLEDLESPDTNDVVDESDDIDGLLEQAQDLIQNFGGDEELKRSLDKALDASFLSEAVEAAENVAGDTGTVAEDSHKLSKASSLTDKLLRVQALLGAHKIESDESASGDPDAAPDPAALDVSELASLKEQMATARKDPEHVAALRRLCVALRPPLSIAPELKSFNQAIQLAYFGANDDIRRVLWRTYTKARTLPTFLQNLSDDAWDLLYYSQAVKWSSNENRQQHLIQMLSDMKSVGRQGPPTKLDSTVLI